MSFNGRNLLGLQKKDSGCWDTRTEISSLSGDDAHIIIEPSPATSTENILTDDYIIEPYEMDVEASAKVNEAYVKSEEPKDCGIFMTPESGKPNESKFMRKNSITNSIIGGNLAVAGEKGSCKSVTSIMINPSLGSGESRSSLISSGGGGGGDDGGKDGHGRATPGTERWHDILKDITIPFFIAGLGMVGAGLLLDEVMVS